MTGPEFRTARKALGYTSRVSVAAALGVSPDTIQRWETYPGELRRIIGLAMIGLQTVHSAKS